MVKFSHKISTAERVEISFNKYQMKAYIEIISCGSIVFDPLRSICEKASEINRSRSGLNSPLMEFKKFSYLAIDVRNKCEFEDKGWT